MAPKYENVEKVVDGMDLLTVNNLILQHQIVTAKEKKDGFFRSLMVHENILRILFNRRRELMGV